MAIKISMFLNKPRKPLLPERQCIQTKKHFNSLNLFKCFSYKLVFIYIRPLHSINLNPI